MKTKNKKIKYRDIVISLVNTSCSRITAVTAAWKG